jgi:HlyD family secretion protein
MTTKQIILITLTAGLLVGCGAGKKQYDASGIFETTEVLVSAKGNGELVRFNVKEGDEVDSLTVLGYIDTIQLYLRKQQLLAGIGAVQNRKANVPAQMAAFQKQLETLRREQKRFENLVKANAANQKQLDDINSQIDVVTKQLEAQTEILNSGNSSLSGEGQSLRIQIAQIDDMIRNSMIISPIYGIILDKYAEQGELAVQGRALFKVADITNMQLRVYITAAQLTTIKLGQKVTVYSDWGEKDRRTYAGVITWVSDKAEFTPKTIQTRDERANLVYAVKIAVTNDGYIKKGMYGEVSFKSE